jgi:hypothetical protein
MNSSSSNRSINKANRSDFSEQDIFESFCLMVLEEFMMKKNLSKTLSAFRDEYHHADSVITINIYLISTRFYLIVYKKINLQLDSSHFKLV